MVIPPAAMNNHRYSKLDEALTEPPSETKNGEEEEKADGDAEAALSAAWDLMRHTEKTEQTEMAKKRPWVLRKTPCLEAHTRPFVDTQTDNGTRVITVSVTTSRKRAKAFRVRVPVRPVRHCPWKPVMVILVYFCVVYGVLAWVLAMAYSKTSL